MNTSTAHFYDGDTDVVLQTRNANGGSTFTLFDKVSSMINHAARIGVEIANVVTHHDC